MEPTSSRRAQPPLLHLGLCAACRTYLNQPRKRVGLSRQTGLTATDPGIVVRVLVVAARQACEAGTKRHD